jgi:zinc transporter
MTTADGLICGYEFDGRGGARTLDWDGVRAHAPGAGWTWIHLQRDAAASREWLERESGLDEVLCEALLSNESRPRCEGYGEGVLLSLRGVNLNPDADPEDMVALVLYADAQRVISVRRRRIMAVDSIRSSVDAGRAPMSTGDFLATLSEGLVERMGPVIDSLEEAVADLEEELVTGHTEGIRLQLAELRRTAIGLRRYIAPQREAMARLLGLPAEWISSVDRRWLREVGDRITRYVEDLDAARERAQIVQEELAARVSEQINRNMYVLSIITAIFLPLGLITGYLGINVGGIPGADWRWAFFMVGLVLLGIAGIQLWLLRRMKWL